MKIGVLALQGAFREHCQRLVRYGVEAAEIRTANELDEVAGLILPGGESTTIGKLLGDWGIMDRIRQRAAQGMAIFGTCAGLILLAKTIHDSDQPRLGLMDITVRRNAFGRQVDSFEAAVIVPALGEAPFPAVFIRAPLIEKAEKNVEVLAEVKGKIVMARQDKFLATSFHPELTDDTRVHQYFINMARE
jgi:5'-phosphate synthase pdxT subunit